MFRIPHLLAFFVFTMACGTSSAIAGALQVALAETEIRFAWADPALGPVEIREVPLHDGAHTGVVVWSGDAALGKAAIPRFDRQRDRLYSSYALIGSATGKTSPSPQYATDFAGAATRAHSLERPASKKGVGCVVNFADAVALGAKWIKVDIDIAALIDWASPEPAMSFEFQGRKIGLRAGAVARLDRSLSEAAREGIGILGVLLNYVPKHAGAEKSPLVHPRTKPALVPMGPAAFNTSTPDGLHYYEGIVHWLIERYTAPGFPHGRMSDLVVGNELQSHWMWYHMGEATKDDVIHAYHKAVRIADLAARSIHRDFRIYISMEHHWTLRGGLDDDLREISGVDLLRSFADTARAHGDFPWHVAFHPYPENLFEPRFWNDRTAPLRPDAPRVTFRNLEVLDAYLAQPHMLHQGKPRRVVLTEQGFHSGKEPGAEDAQAAAFAYAWKRIAAMPGIDLFIYHRHVDHPHEGGLKLGLRAHDGSPNPAGMGEKRKIWEVFRAADTAGENAAFAFALPIVGRHDWKDVVADKLESSPGALPVGEEVVFDFVARRKAATVSDTLALERKHVVKAAGWLARGLQQHPKSNVTSIVTWDVPLPAGKPLSMDFTANLNNAASNGVVFAVKVDGKEAWRHPLKGGESADASIDLTSSAGKTVKIAFEIDPQGPSQNDWAVWQNPRIVVPAK